MSQDFQLLHIVIELGEHHSSLSNEVMYTSSLERVKLTNDHNFSYRKRYDLDVVDSSLELMRGEGVELIF